jgi:hypothetical protein
MNDGRWHKCGRIFLPDGSRWWMKTHAASPIPLPLEGDRVRILISGRDEQGRARIGALNVSLAGPAAPIVADEPLADLGPLGSFDENGMVGGCAVPVGEQLYIYYSGFQRGVTVPFWFFGGLLISDDLGLTARRFSNAPVLDRSDADPIIAGAPWILRDGGRWRMWYTSGVRWERNRDDLRHFYHIKYAESDDGLHWRRDGIVAIDFRDGEYALGRPCVIRDPDKYRMWYSRRGPSYRIGYAESDDGLNWERRDDLAGIDASADGWDSQMIEYAAVFDHAGTRWMLYNGNGYGESGLGLARWSPEA